MNPNILVVDDNAKILHNVELMLGTENYNVLTATNGLDALDILEKMEISIDLIICDIMMPKMDGYTLYKSISDDPLFFDIPFIFISEWSTPDDIRFAKLLGVDDYITKPFDESYFLAIIRGKLLRREKKLLLTRKVEEKLLPLKIDDEDISKSEKEEALCIVLLMHWDELKGPKLIRKYTESKDLPYAIDEISLQIFQTIVSIFSDVNKIDIQGFLMNLEEINLYCYVYFDTISNDLESEKNELYMMCAIAPKINYLESLRIEEEFNKCLNEIKRKIEFDLKQVYNSITNFLKSS